MVNYPLDTSNTPYADRPLVTFALFAYNQEKYIREAIEGAFAQTYQPLEVILSDDCSKDRTFEIMEEMAQEYRGPHQIVLNRNPSNLGIAGHINKMMELCRTDFVVVAAGDDISLPERTERMVEVWLKSDRRAKSVHSSAMCIDDASRDLGCQRHGKIDLVDPTIERVIREQQWVLGAANAWDRDVFAEFGPLMSGAGHEDVVISLRALQLGEIRYISEPLVKYRIGIGVTASSQANGLAPPPQWYLWGRYRTYLQLCSDLMRSNGAPELLDKLKRDRARWLLAYWFAKNRRFSPSRYRLFFKRCSPKIVAWEYLRYRRPRVFSRLYQFRRLV